MADNVKAWPKATGVPMKQPQQIARPCDWGLQSAVQDAETQLGTIEAYNRLCQWAAHLKARIDAGDVKAQHPMFAKSLRGE